MDTRCVIIGATGRASQIQKMLSTSSVATIAIAHNTGKEAIIAACNKLSSLKVIAVLCRDFPMDMGLGLLAELREKCEEGVGLHAFVEDHEALKAIRDDFDDLDAEVLCDFPLEPFKIASTIKQRWFNKDEEENPEASSRRHRGNGSANQSKGGNGSTGDRVSMPGARLVKLTDRRPAAVSVTQRTTVGALAAPLAPQAHTRTQERRQVAAPRTATMERPGAAVTPPPQSKPAAVAPPALTIGDDLQGVLGEILKSFRRNDPLPKVPVSVPIVGKGGTTVKLDPRRIKPLPKQPRQDSNPGFSQESLQGLGEQIRLAGQLEEIMVCPIKGDPEYDAQLVDGERRLRSCKLVGIYIYATVREDITPEQARALYLISVMRNSEKEPFSAYDNVRIVNRLRFEFKMGYREIEQACSKTAPWVSQQLMLGKLHEEVQQMLEGGTNPRKITSQIAVLLADISPEKQRATAEAILDQRMNYTRARRYVIDIRRGLGLARTTTRGARPAVQFDALRTLLRRNMDAFGIYLDMPSAELTNVILRQTAGERSGVCQDLQTLAKDLTVLAKRIESLE